MFMLLTWLQSRYYYLRAVAYRTLGNRWGSADAYRRAVEELTRAIALDLVYASAYCVRGTLYWRELGDTARAERDLTRAIELAPQHARAYLNRAFARAYASPPDASGAMADFRRYLELDRDPYWRGVAEQELARLAETRERGI